MFWNGVAFHLGLDAHLGSYAGISELPVPLSSCGLSFHLLEVGSVLGYGFQRLKIAANLIGRFKLPVKSYTGR